MGMGMEPCRRVIILEQTRSVSLLLRLRLMLTLLMLLHRQHRVLLNQITSGKSTSYRTGKARSSYKHMGLGLARLMTMEASCVTCTRKYSHDDRSRDFSY